MPVEYDISWRDPNERLYDIQIRFTAPSDSPTLQLAAWRPGRYLIQNFAANVREWEASAPIRKSGKSSWVVDARAGEAVEVRYRYFAGVLDAGSSFLDPTEAYFNGSNLFMMVEGSRQEPVTLRIHADPSWKIATQMRRDDAGREVATFNVRDWDYLIDSPVIAAPALREHSFEEGGATIRLVFVGSEGIDTDQFVEPTRRIARQQRAIFGAFPFAEYTFLYHVSDKWHGVEHEDSCSIIVRREPLIGAGPGQEAWDHFLSITSHELFHVWNVKRILPASFLPYDFSKETPTSLLWAMEGTTSYFADLTIARSGIWTDEQYLKRLAKQVTTYEGSPARQHLSLAQASFDGWLQDPLRPHDRGNAWYSFYNKGEIVSALLDLTMRARSGKSLDDVMRYLWSEYGERRRGLEEDAIQRAVEQVTGESYAEFFQRFVHGTDELPYRDVLAPFGIEAAIKPAAPSLGLKTRAAEGALLVDSVVRGGTGMTAGVLPGDELLAVSGERVRAQADIDRALKLAGGSAELLVSRNGRLATLQAAVRNDGSRELEFRVVDPENALRRDWLGRAE